MLFENLKKFIAERHAEKAERQEKMVEVKKVKSFFDGLADVLGTVASVPIIGGVLKAIFTNTGEHFEKKIKEAFGLSAEDADKTTDDESLFEKALIDAPTLKSEEKKSITEYLTRLRKANPRLAKEWVRWIHNTLVKFGQQTILAPEKGNKGKKKNQGGEEAQEQEKIQGGKRTFTDYSEGIRIVENLLRDLASAQDDFAREAFLTQRNICVKEIKPHPIVVKAKEFAKKTATEVVDGEKGNREDFNQTMSGLRDRAKAWREKK